MSITLTPEQEHLIRTQLATGRYTNAAEVITDALQLLEKRERYQHWLEEVRAKIDLAAEQLDRGEGVDGETAIAQLQEKLSHNPLPLSNNRTSQNLSTGASILAALKSMGTWQGDDFEECRQAVYDSRSPADFNDNNPFD